MKTISALAASLAFLWSAGAAQNWTRINTDVTGILFGLHFLNAQTGWIAGENQVILKTTNGGGSWIAQAGSPGNVTAFAFANPNLGWASGGLTGGGGFILKTTNGGDAWTRYDAAFPILWGIYFLDSFTGWVSGEGGGIWKTTDGGTTWTPQNSGTSTSFQLITFLNADIGWVVGASGTIRKTTDGGNTWTAQNSGTVQALGEASFIDAQTGWCVGYAGTILKTTNGGTSWTAQTSTTFVNLSAVQFRDANTGYAAGVNGLILKTTNGGGVWATQNTRPTTATLLSIQMPAGGGGWAAGHNGVVLKLAGSAPSNLQFASNPASYTEGQTITPNPSSVSGTAPFTYSARFPLPPGLSLNPATGVISGTPAAGSSTNLPGGQTYYNFLIATNSLGADTVDFEATILPPVTALAFGGRTKTLGFHSPRSSRVVFDIPGQGVKAARLEIRTMRGERIWEGIQTAGNDLAWNGKTLNGDASPTGVYLVRVTWLDGNKRPVGSVSKRFAHLRP